MQPPSQLAVLLLSIGGTAILTTLAASILANRLIEQRWLAVVFSGLAFPVAIIFPGGLIVASAILDPEGPAPGNVIQGSLFSAALVAPFTLALGGLATVILRRRG